MELVEFDSEQNKLFLNNQVNAVARVISLTKEKVTIEEVLRRLSEAEQKANFFCGFQDIYEAEGSYKDQLKEYLVVQGFVSVDKTDIALLLPKGEEMAKVVLPSQIEEVL